MKTAKEITKRSTLLATIRSEFPKSTAIDLENELFDMINKALMLGGTVGRSEQLKPKQQICYKNNEPCKYDCSGLCKESY